MRIAVTLVLPILLMLSLFGFDFLYSMKTQQAAGQAQATRLCAEGRACHLGP
ncbi:hypothetical protein [Pseudomonas panipatensis]|uniref:Uncharacterized protein n=1 Tax=Pseudomonas panipatensis TaxID=428992 RepID=A0A1G8BDL7_9PSED|nr:hypothetical protein [Pseudomonas panipatensis]SDH31315.1 hypothetical protein SAMN05216272_10115 [Pseudomonas panipatensis]SMP80027.1 hypothetical protein SAMN06295951_1247 [Pseudomonas panipatensis]